MHMPRLIHLIELVDLPLRCVDDVLWRKVQNLRR